MKLGTVFPHSDIGTDPAAIRDFAQAQLETAIRMKRAIADGIGC